jgi:peptidoglycan/LPS O-acetylase OafA/YrhL
MEAHSKSGHGKNHYGRLIAMVVLSFLAMYVLMYAMVDRWDNVFANVNQFYMAGLMAAPMLIIELVLMAGMYPNRRLNLILSLVAAVFMLVCWFGIRQQWGVGDRQFVKSMIPHHAGAILMCEQNRLQDPALQQLCGEIVASQQREIAQMKALLDRQ